MSTTTLEIDRNISTLRTNSKEFYNLSNIQLTSMLEELISNINEVAYYWATICSDNKGTTKTPAEGEEWMAGPFAAVLATQYYIDTLDDLAETMKIIIDELQGDDVSLESYPKNLPVGRPNELIPAKHLTVNWGDFELLEITE